VPINHPGGAVTAENDLADTTADTGHVPLASEGTGMNVLQARRDVLVTDHLREQNDRGENDPREIRAHLNPVDTDLIRIDMIDATEKQIIFFTTV
jgi:hypothetical protein